MTNIEKSLDKKSSSSNKTVFNKRTNRKLKFNSRTHRRLLNSMEKNIINPLTGRKVLEGGTLHKSLINQGLLDPPTESVVKKLISQVTSADVGEMKSLEELLKNDILTPDETITCKVSASENILVNIRQSVNEIVSKDLLTLTALRFIEISKITFENNSLSQTIYFNGGEHIITDASQINAEVEKSLVTMMEKIVGWLSFKPGWTL